MLSHVLDVRGPRIDERHVLAGLYHMGADIAAHRTRSDNGYLPAHTFLQAFLGNANASATRYGLMPASWITFAHFGMSALIRALNSSGGTAEGSYPIAAIFSLRSGDATARAISRYKRLMISRGVPAGAQTHCGASCTWPGTPASSIVGTSERIAIRFVLVTASARSRPSLICADADGSVANATGVWPPTTDCTIGPPPPNGTVTMSRLSDSLNSSVDRCGGVPAPAMAKLLYFPARTSATSSCTVLAGTDGCTTSTSGDVAPMMIGSKSLTGS